MSFPCENLGSEYEFGGGNILNYLSLVEFILVRKVKAVCILAELQTEWVVERLCNISASPSLCDRKPTKQCYREGYNSLVMYLESRLQSGICFQVLAGVQNT